MKRRKIHILYEHGVDKRPFGSASIRLLRPFTHPGLRQALEITSGLTYAGQDVDAVIVDRLWRPDITPSLAEQLLESIQIAGTRCIYALDDSLLDLPGEKKDWDPTDARLWVVKFFLERADGILVTTQALKEKISKFNTNIVVIPHALDERLLPAWRSPERAGQGGMKDKVNRHIDLLASCGPAGWSSVYSGRKVIGYMGTLTHDDDLMMILQSLQAIGSRFRQEVSFEFVGVVRHPDTYLALKGLPVRFHRLTPKRAAYTRFMHWFTRCMWWDIAISPLKESPFNGSKSDIKFLDYSAIGAAGIFSRVPAYQDSVRHLETGWLADNKVESWIEALETLITNDSLRKQLADNATRYLYTERTLARCVYKWREAINTLLS